jgi:hypothetical protein
VIARLGPQRIASSRTTPFEALARAVVYQSVSGKAAASIFARVNAARLDSWNGASGRPFTLRQARLSYLPWGKIRGICSRTVAWGERPRVRPAAGSGGLAITHSQNFRHEKVTHVLYGF